MRELGGSEITYPYTVDIRDIYTITMTGNYSPKPTITRTRPEPCEVIARVMGIGRPNGGIASAEMDIFIPNSKKLDKLIAAYALREYSRTLNNILHDMKFYRVTLTYQDDLKGHFVASVTGISMDPISEIEVKTANQASSHQFEL
jgi:hypothetical protein